MKTDETGRSDEDRSGLSPTQVDTLAPSNGT
jgi:hypothetical protein